MVPLLARGSILFFLLLQPFLLGAAELYIFPQTPPHVNGMSMECLTLWLLPNGGFSPLWVPNCSVLFIHTTFCSDCVPVVLSTSPMQSFPNWLFFLIFFFFLVKTQYHLDGNMHICKVPAYRDVIFLSDLCSCYFHHCAIRGLFEFFFNQTVLKCYGITLL